jgi:Uma2 family endonuclease
MTRATLERFNINEDLPLTFNFELTDDAFFEFCRLNRDLRIERDKTGTIHIMAPTGFETGNFNNEISAELTIWNRKMKSGRVGDSSTGYILPNSAVRSPDASWISYERLAGIPREQLEKFPRVCPEFVIEIRSPNDSLSKVKQKMEEYIENGCRLGWLIDRGNKQVFVYRANGSISLVESLDQVLSGEDVLPGFELVPAYFM